MDSSAAPDGRLIGHSGIQFQGSFHFLVGRTREQAALRSELVAAAGGNGRLCLIGGEAGIGKTTLARDLVRTADDLGARVLTGSCYDLTSTPPYGPWLDLFDACQRDPTLPPAPAAFAGGQLASITDQAPFSPMCGDSSPRSPPTGRRLSSSKISIGPTRPASTSSDTSVPMCGIGRCSCS